MSPKKVIVSLYNIMVATCSMASRVEGTDDRAWSGDGIHGKVAEAFKRAIRETYPDVADTLTDRLYSMFGDTLDVDDIDSEAQAIRDEMYNEAVAHKVALTLDAVALVRNALRPDDKRHDLFQHVYNMLATGQHMHMLDDDIRALRDRCANLGAWCETRLDENKVDKSDPWNDLKGTNRDNMNRK